MIYRKLALLFTIEFFAVGIFLACYTENKPTFLPNSEASQAQPEAPTPEPRNDYINEDGWQIPSSQLKTRTRKKVSAAKTISGDPVSISSITYGLSQPIKSEDPGKAVNRNSESPVRIWSFTEFKANDKVFCYVLEAQPLSPNSNEGRGVKFFYRICDLNGDTKFETLSFDSASFEKKAPVIPDWVTK